MKDFLLSKNSQFPFDLFGFQHILMLFITFALFILIFIYKPKLVELNAKTFNKIRNFMIIIILLNMFVYRGSYLFYGVYDIKIHLSLYYCHIVNYFFVFALIINYNPFYKIVYGLSWMGGLWSILFPEFQGGIDSFIFYSFFISHNLLLIFTTFILNIRNIRYKFKDLIKSLFVAVLIFVFTNLINYEFNTKYNTPISILGKYSYYGILRGYDILILAGFVGNLIALCINKIYTNVNFISKTEEKK